MPGHADRPSPGGQSLQGTVATAILAHVVYQLDMRSARRAWATLAAREVTVPSPFGPEMIADLPEPGRRYLSYSIAPSTPIRTTVELDMRGQFALGDKESHRVMPMRARQLLSPPNGFVWIPDIGSGVMRIWGSDALVAGEAWTRFWILGLIPVARQAGTADVARSAATRSIMEAIWAPASLLPQNGAEWQAVGESSARVTFQIEGKPMSMTMTIAADGRPLTVSTMRWSNTNPDGVFRWQPFGGSMLDWATFHGFTIPTRVEVGNHYGTEDYFPFFRAEIVTAEYP